MWDKFSTVNRLEVLRQFNILWAKHAIAIQQFHYLYLPRSVIIFRKQRFRISQFNNKLTKWYREAYCHAKAVMTETWSHLKFHHKSKFIKYVTASGKFKIYRSSNSNYTYIFSNKNWR